MHPDFVQYHPRYPLSLPLAEEHIYSLLGTVDDRLSKIVVTMLHWGLVLTVAGGLQRRFRWSRAWLGALILATVPVLMPYEYGFACAQADAPVACFHGLSVLYIWLSLPGREQSEVDFHSFIMAGFLAAFGAFTKDEGIAYVMVDAVALGLLIAGSLFLLDRFRQLLFALLIYVGTFLILIVPWFIHRRRLPLTTEMNYFGRMTVSMFFSRLDTLQWSVPHLLRRMFWEWRDWGLQWWLAVAALVSYPFRALQQRQLFLALDLLGSLASLLVAGMLAPAQLDEHIGGSSHRFLMQIAPVAILFAVTTFFDEEPSTHSSGEPRTLARR
jgi:hypothetical protein